MTSCLLQNFNAIKYHLKLIVMQSELTQVHNKIETLIDILIRANSLLLFYGKTARLKK